jgi:glycosyltransferase
MATSSPAPAPVTITVVTVALNAERTIRRTIDSVLAQSSRPDEYIVVDGGSTDRTAAIAREYSGCAVLSRRDRGIYDGMNRGLQAATGEVVGFLNANDAYAHGHVIERIRAVFSDPRVDACYGDLDFVNVAGRTTRRWRSSPFAQPLLHRGWMPPHPTFYARRRVLVDAGGFDDRFQIAGDYELFIRLLAVRHIWTEFIPEVLVKMESGGVSNGSLRNIFKANREVVRAWTQNGLPPPALIGMRKPLAKVFQLRLSW